MYQNNIFTIKQLQDSEIEPIEKNGVRITNLYELLKLNQVLMHKKGTRVNITAPKYKFVINNAANIGSNINGSRMFIPRSFYNSIEEAIAEIKQSVFDDKTVNEEKLTEYTKELETQLDEKYKKLNSDYETEVKELNSKKRSKIMTIREYNKLLELKNNQKIFERTEIVPLENKLFLFEVLKENPDFYYDFEKNAAIWFRDSQQIFGLYRSLQRGIFCPTSSMMDAMDNCSLKYNTTEPKEVGTSYSEIIYKGQDGKKISFGGVVINYNENVNGNEELTSKIYYTLDCNVGANILEDKMTINTIPIKVSESNDLKARVAYKGVVNMIKQIYDSTGEIEQVDGIDYIKEMWKRMQYQYDQRGFNMLLSATALKTMGDYLQECQACFKWGGYVNNTDAFPDDLKMTSSFKNIKDKLIYRSVSKDGSIIPYDEVTGNGLRLGIQGDRPSGFRSIYMLLNGDGDVNDQAITGYMFTSSTQNPSRTLLVARNNGKINSNGLKGSVIFVTRELQVPDRDGLLRSLEFLNVKEKTRKVEGEIVTPKIDETTIIGSTDVNGQLLENPMSKIKPLKNSAYELQLDYNDTSFVPEQDKSEVETEKTDAEEARDKRQNNFKVTKGLKPEEKKVTKEQLISAKKLINRLRDDLTPKQKEQTKTIPFIPVKILDSMKKIIMENGISEQIFNIIHSDSEGVEEYERQEAEKKAQIAQKRADTSAEKNEIKTKISEIQVRINELKSELKEPIDELNKQIQSKQNEYNTLTGNRSNYAKIISKERVLLTERNKKPKTDKTKAEQQANIEKFEEELQNLKEMYKEELERIEKISNEIKDLNQQKDSVESPIREMDQVLVQLNTKLKSKKGGTLSNKKTYIHRVTKRYHKRGNKLTKKSKKTKIPKKTRKYIRLSL